MNFWKFPREFIDDDECRKNYTNINEYKEQTIVLLWTRLKLLSSQCIQRAINTIFSFSISCSIILCTRSSHIINNQWCSFQNLVRNNCLLEAHQFIMDRFSEKKSRWALGIGAEKRSERFVMETQGCWYFRHKKQPVFKNIS